MILVGSKATSATHTAAKTRTAAAAIGGGRGCGYGGKEETAESSDLRCKMDASSGTETETETDTTTETTTPLGTARTMCVQHACRGTQGKAAKMVAREGDETTQPMLRSRANRQE